MTTTRVVLVRHGETDWNARGVYQGWRDVPLNGRGRSQARALATALAGVAIDAAYSSPLSRARETAEIALGARFVRACQVSAFRELSYGEWEGLAPEERRAGWPLLEERWATDPWNVQFPGGESLATLAERVLPVWERLLAAHMGETVLLCGHGHLNRVIMLHARRLDRADFWAVAQPNGSVTTLECVPVTHAAGVTA